MAQSPSDGLRLLDDGSLADALDGYHLYYAARADLLRRAGRYDEAKTAYRRALGLTTNEVERAYLERRRREMQTALERS
jgi:RNA polymerase sigma-70 factor (ECF subfamily)